MPDRSLVAQLIGNTLVYSAVNFKKVIPERVQLVEMEFLYLMSVLPKNIHCLVDGVDDGWDCFHLVRMQHIPESKLFV